MARLLSSHSVETLKTLLDQLARLEGGSLDMGAFSAWFKSLRWDSSVGFNTYDLAPLGWAIETSLFEYEDFPHLYIPADLRDAVETVLRREGYEPLEQTLSQRLDTFSVYAGGRDFPVIRSSLHRRIDQDPPAIDRVVAISVPA